MSTDGYYRFPTLRDDKIVFISEDDLWVVPAGGGTARRLTCGLAGASRPALSPDGQWVAFSGREEGNTEVYVMPAEGGQPQRLTYLAGGATVLGWNAKGQIIFSAMMGQPNYRLSYLYAISPKGGVPEPLPVGPARSISFGPRGASVIARHGGMNMDLSWWKRYKGGTAGELWVDTAGRGNFHPLIKIKGNVAAPMWIGSRIYFLADHEGTGNIYSCTPAGKDLKRHTDHQDYYARQPMSDGRRIVYVSGGDVHILDTSTGRTEKVKIDYRSPRTQTQRKFVEGGRYFEDFDVHPQGHSQAITIRGKALTIGNWEGPVQQFGQRDGVRYRLVCWLNDGKRLVGLNDASGEEMLEIFSTDPLAKSHLLPKLNLGRATEIKVSPQADQIALSNHRCELLWVDLKTKKLKVIDRSHFGQIAGFNWSPDGRWVVYGFVQSPHCAVLKIWNAKTGQTRALTGPDHGDFCPSFDPEGKYICFISARFFDPVADTMQFQLGFPRGSKPCLITLRKDLPSPFVAVPKPLDGEAKPDPSKQGKPDKKKPDDKPKPIEIDFDGIFDRVLEFPVPLGNYQQIEAIRGKVLFTSAPIEGMLGRSWANNEPEARQNLEAFDFATLKSDALVQGLTWFKLSADRKTLVYQAGRRLRAIKAGEKPDDNAAKEGPGRKSGWIDLGRAKVSIVPPLEWKQMYREAWRLQRDHFWSEDMSKIDWKAIYKRYLPLVDRVATRSEVADLIWEMQGELGTSHAYVMGGDYRPEPHYEIGLLGADISLDRRTGRYRIDHIVKGDSWDEGQSSPLARPGMNIKEGDTILAVAGRPVSREQSPAQLLVNLSGTEVQLTIGDRNGKHPRTISVKPQADDTRARYREWVDRNRAIVHKATKGKIGYVHIPDMSAAGFAEFHRYYLPETDRDGMIIDVRFNGGGNVSMLLLEKLERKRIGFDKTRWFGVFPYPGDSPGGPLVALTNEYAGSDGDIFSHSFKLMKLGPLIGKRTWGGVIGIWPRSSFVDGGLTTQPEFSFWFKDVGWGVENYGTDPDIEVDITPQDYVKKKDPQLERGIAEGLKLLKENPPLKLDLEGRPNLKAPRLPGR